MRYDQVGRLLVATARAGARVRAVPPLPPSARVSGGRCRGTRGPRVATHRHVAPRTLEASAAFRPQARNSRMSPNYHSYTQELALISHKLCQTLPSARQAAQVPSAAGETGATRGHVCGDARRRGDGPLSLPSSRRSIPRRSAAWWRTRRRCWRSSPCRPSMVAPAYVESDRIAVRDGATAAAGDEGRRLAHQRTPDISPWREEAMDERRILSALIAASIAAVLIRASQKTPVSSGILRRIHGSWT